MATGLQFLGTTALKTGEFKVNFGTKGMSTHFSVFSPDIPTLTAYLNSIGPAGVTGVIEGVDGGENRVINIQVPGLTTNMVGVLNELFFDSWELVTNNGTDTIFADPLIVGGVTPVLNYNDKVVLSRLARDGGTVASAVTDCNADIQPAGTLIAPTGGNFSGGNNGQFQVPTSGVALQLALEIQKGQTEFESPQRVLRHTSYCSPQSTYNIQVTHEEYIYTKAELLTEISTGWVYNCPPRLISKISAILPLTAAPEEAPYYTWGWKKTFSREAVLPDFVMEINTEYALGLWSNIRYSTF